MTDITDQDCAKVNRVLEQMQGHVDNATWYTGRPAEWLRDLREVFPAPAPTLAEELRAEAPGVPGYDLATLAARVEKIEQHNDEVVGIVEGLTEQRDEARKERDHFFREVENVRTWKEQLLNERDEAQAEVERLTAERDRIASGRHITYAEMDGKPVQKGAESPNPADVPAGEAWIVKVDGGRCTAVKDGTDYLQWNTVNLAGIVSPERNEDITLISRLVPAPRVITDPDELDKLATRAVILSTDVQADVYQHDRDGWVDITGTPMDSRSVIRMERAVTVLWEPDA